jgi:large subunit ribosomal protein L13
MKSTHVRAAEIEERWLLYDASEHTLGRMATQIAMHLMGKDRPTYTASELCGAHVVVINAAESKLTGKKGATKTYAHYTRYPGGYKSVSIEDVREARAGDIVSLAVRRMLPKNKLGHDMLRRLKVYSGAEHPHVAQRPVKVEPNALTGGARK